MRIFKYLIPVVIAIIALASCKKIETLPDTPHIEFRSFAVFDTSDILDNNCKGGRLNIYFEDGDGDLGLEPPVYENDDTVDMYFTLYRKKGTIFSEVPYMERTGQNKALRGTISVTFLYLYYSPEDTDTVKYEFYIKDRAQHISDTVITSEIKLSVNGVYL
jgi:hypothetical protein